MHIYIKKSGTAAGRWRKRARGEPEQNDVEAIVPPATYHLPPTIHHPPPTTKMMSKPLYSPSRAALAVEPVRLRALLLGLQTPHVSDPQPSQVDAMHATNENSTWIKADKGEQNFNTDPKDYCSY